LSTEATKPRLQITTMEYNDYEELTKHRMGQQPEPSQPPGGPGLGKGGGMQFAGVEPSSRGTQGSATGLQSAGMPSGEQQGSEQAQRSLRSDVPRASAADFSSSGAGPTGGGTGGWQGSNIGSTAMGAPSSLQGSTGARELERVQGGGAEVPRAGQDMGTFQGTRLGGEPADQSLEPGTHESSMSAAYTQEHPQGGYSAGNFSSSKQTSFSSSGLPGDSGGTEAGTGTGTSSGQQAPPLPPPRRTGLQGSLSSQRAESAGLDTTAAQLNDSSVPLTGAGTGTGAGFGGGGSDSGMGGPVLPQAFKGSDVSSGASGGLGQAGGMEGQLSGSQPAGTGTSDSTHAQSGSRHRYIH
jgi:hypothetical protein